MDTIEFARLRELVAASRTYRRFDEARPVPRELLEALVDVARLAPTGNNTQTLRFHLSVVTRLKAVPMKWGKWTRTNVSGRKGNNSERASAARCSPSPFQRTDFTAHVSPLSDAEFIVTPCATQKT